MKILHIVAGDLLGGAAKGAYNLHRGLLHIGIESRMILQNAGGDDLFIEPISKSMMGLLVKKYRTFCDYLPVMLYHSDDFLLFSTGMSGCDVTRVPHYEWADVIHLHWINSGMINTKSLRDVEKPLIWTMRDMWPFTGGCHCVLDCVKYIGGCGACPQLRSKRKFDLSRYIVRRKKRYYPDKLQLVALSTWLAECAKKSAVFKNRTIQVIYNSINTEEYFPVDREVARISLGLPNGRKIILTGAATLAQEHKGFSKFREAVKNVSSDYLFLFFGHVDHRDLDALRINYKTLGYLNDTVTMRLAYSASDVFVAPSIQEAFGKTLAEAMACGVPVVAFDATGPKDIIDHKVNGYLAKPFEGTDLGHGIEWILGDKCRYKILSENAINKVEQNFSLAVVANKYFQLYNDIL